MCGDDEKVAVNGVIREVGKDIFADFKVEEVREEVFNSFLSVEIVESGIGVLLVFGRSHVFIDESLHFGNVLSMELRRNRG